MYKLDIPVDPKQTAAIERRRNAEQQRQSRIFNARYRTIGVDRPFLDLQVEEKKTREGRERLRAEAFDAERLRCDQTAQRLEEEERKLVRRLNEELVDYRARHQRTEDCRDFDLYDPEGLRKECPARVSQDDPRCGPSGMQRFAGEDPSEAARRRFQRQEAQRWLTAQRQEKERAARDQERADDLFHKKQIELDQRAVELSRMEEDCRRALDTATLNYNVALAAERAAAREVERRKEEEEKLAEVGSHVYGDVLTENPEVAVSALGPHRVVPDRWKGMGPQQLEEIRQQQRLQVQEKKKLKMEEAQQDAEWDRQRLADARAALAREQLEQEAARRLRQQMDTYNRQLAHQEYLDKEVYTNAPTAEYFLQFNTTSR